MENFLDKTFSYEKHISLPASAATTFVKIADNQKLEMLLLRISDLENRLSDVCEAIAEKMQNGFTFKVRWKLFTRNIKFYVGSFRKKRQRKVGQVYTKKRSQKVKSLS